MRSKGANMSHEFFKSSRKKIVLTELQNVVSKVQGEIIRLDYYPEHFGNIILHFKKGEKIYEYVVDRGDIYFNKKGVCSNSYVRDENKHPYQKLIEIVISTVT